MQLLLAPRPACHDFVPSVEATRRHRVVDPGVASGPARSRRCPDQGLRNEGCLSGGPLGRTFDVVDAGDGMINSDLQRESGRRAAASKGFSTTPWRHRHSAGGFLLVLAGEHPGQRVSLESRASTSSVPLAGCRDRDPIGAPSSHRHAEGRPHRANIGPVRRPRLHHERDVT